MHRLRKLLTTDDDRLRDVAVLAALIAIVVAVAFLFLGGETSMVWRGVGSSV